jgi:hypothetical protein
MTLSEFYRITEAQHNQQQEKINEYVALAKNAGVAEEEYKKDTVYIALVTEAEKYRFAKNLIMQHIKPKDKNTFFKR